MTHTILEQYAKQNGYNTVSEAVSAMGSLEFRRKSRKFALSNKQPEALKMEIKKIGCRWLVNGKQLQDCSDWEKDFMNKFFQEVRIEKLVKA